MREISRCKVFHFGSNQYHWTEIETVFSEEGINFGHVIKKTYNLQVSHGYTFHILQLTYRTETYIFY